MDLNPHNFDVLLFEIFISYRKTVSVTVHTAGRNEEHAEED